MKIINLKLERFRDRVEFSGNPSKYDVSVTLRSVQLGDEGIYNCYIMNPPDRHRGHGKIYLQVLMEGEGRVGRAGSPTQPAALGAPLESPCPPGACAGWEASALLPLLPGDWGRVSESPYRDLGRHRHPKIAAFRAWGPGYVSVRGLTSTWALSQVIVKNASVGEASLLSPSYRRGDRQLPKVTP